MRDGLPLPGLTPEQVVSQLVHRVLGPLHPNRLRLVLDFHGLAGAPAAALDETARRNHITVGMVSVHTAKVRAAGAALRLHPAIVTAAMRPTRAHEDHLGRTRVARTLGLPTPAAPSKPHTAVSATPAELAAARSAIRILAATGPLDMSTLLEALTRARRWTGPNALTAGSLAAALLTVNATQDVAGRWQAPPESPVPERYRVILAADAGQELTRQEVTDILTAAGYTASSAAGLMISTHPLFIRTGHNRYRVLTSLERQS